MEIRPVLVAARLIAVDVITALAAGAFDATFMIATVVLPDSAHVGRIYTPCKHGTRLETLRGAGARLMPKATAGDSAAGATANSGSSPAGAGGPVGTYFDWLRRLRRRYSDELRLVMDSVVGSR
jgi:hypothetical protein